MACNGVVVLLLWVAGGCIEGSPWEPLDCGGLIVCFFDPLHFRLSCGGACYQGRCGMVRYTGMSICIVPQLLYFGEEGCLLTALDCWLASREHSLLLPPSGLPVQGAWRYGVYRGTQDFWLGSQSC
ncbi:uncharacterized protein P884DRAFT_253655 [Thermothelomyces heterothallicus CBS 202.75]|uniref:uncharacterized protein n=1 Tax=Thermothelomyces heterothallicus CBS 202.75 TaxID=1149848 RepID=UPI0037446852